MKLRAILVLPVAALTVAGAGCGMMQHHSGASGSGHGGMGAGAGGAQPGNMDMARMCEMHRQMMVGKSPAEQQAAIEAHVKSMHGTADPQRVAMHRQMMDRCPAPASR